MKIEEKNGKFTVTDFDAVEAYVIACKIEKDGIKFYQDLLEAADDARLRETFDLLLNEEKEHLHFFENCLYAQQEHAEQDHDEDDLLSSMQYGVFAPLHDAERFKRAVSSPEDALKLGMVAENRAINFYELCKNNVSSPEVKSRLEEIIAEEQRHKDLFKSLWQQLKSGGGGV
ncbi:MAG: hypothetical protein GF333_04895 [Candidatus Omnitrophica bacterium]|nr:hypothetical protein [Candidatus Omnitrophota bacterium]